jgi:glyoxylase-like metal-dependent hydrolase (beta-lactamase superfamily II)
MSALVHAFSFNGFQENTYVISNGSDAVIIDPGCYSKEEQNALKSFIDQQKLQVHAILFTHAHIDHILGAQYCMNQFSQNTFLHALDIPTWEAVERYAALYGFDNYTPAVIPKNLLQDQQLLNFGALEFKVFFTPGHAPGHVVFYHNDGFVVNGDVLFKGSFGRVDLPGGNLETLKNSIHNILFEMPDDTIVYCGHGPATTIGQEKLTNYILQF